MSNGNGVVATLTGAAESVKETASNIGSSIASTASGAVASAKKTAKQARKAATKRVAAAKKAVADAFDRHPVGAFKVPALAVMMAALYGPPDDPVGKPSLASEETPTGENAESGSSAPSTASGRRRGSRRAKSAK